nr:rhamnogalacturonan acetylesterase [uncultured Butyrivibrio sp.]
MKLSDFDVSLKIYPDKAKGWGGGVYYPRNAKLEEINDDSNSHYLRQLEGENTLITSKCWTETEVTGFGIYTYVNSPVFSYKTGLNDGRWTITFYNPDKEAMCLNCYADEVLQIKDLEVAPKSTMEASFINCSIHEVTTLQFFASDSAECEEKSLEHTFCIRDISYEEVKKTADEGDQKGKPTIFLASDSTVQSYEPFYYPQTGWGQVFIDYVCPSEPLEDYLPPDHCYPQCHVYERNSVRVENRSIGARSARSFIDEGKWDALLKRARRGDYVLLQWAHNDATAVRPNRYVSPGEFDSFLMKYIDSCKSRGIYPVLVTPVSRRNCDEHDGEFVLSFGEYRDVMLQVADREKVPCVDLCKMSNDYLKEIGSEEAKALYLWCPSGAYPEGAYADGVSDNTHLQEYGAKIYARMVAKALLSMEGYSEIDRLKAYLNIDAIPEKKKITVIPKEVDLETPTGFALQELIIEDKVANFLLVWNDVKGAVSYNVYRKGSVDFQFFPLRSITAQEKMQSIVLPFRLPAADVYQVKVTAVFEDGKESNPSRIIEFRA